jgi:hypothetical protein
VAGSNYEVNIKLDVRKINQQLNNLERRIKKLNDIAMGQKGVGKAALKTERDKLALATKTFRREQQITKEKAKQNKLENNTAKVVRKTGVRPTSKIPLGPSSPLNFDSQGRMMPGRAKTKGDGVLSGALISGAFPMLFGQGPVGALAGFGGSFIGGKLGGQTGGFAGGLVATAALTQIQQAVTGISELGKALDFFTLDVTTVSKALGASGTPTEEYLKLIQKTQGKQAAFNESMKRMEELVGKDGVEALQRFSEGTRNLQASISRFLTQIGAQAAKLFASGSSRPTGLRRRQLLGDAETSNDEIIKGLLEDRSTAKGKKARDINDLIVERMLELETTKKTTDLDKLRAEQYGQITNSVEKQNQFLNESLTMGSRKAEIEQKLREFDKQALQFDKEIDQAERQQFKNALELQDELERINSLYQGIADTVKSGLVDAIDGAITGTMTLGEVASSVFGSIRRQLIDFGATSLLRSIPGIGGFFADGGVTKPNKSYIVGERGPELFTPGVTGRVTPNHEMSGGSTNVVVNVDASGSSVQGDEGRSRELGRLISVAVQSELLEQKRPGGLLA